jgi:tetratricopeptide (TPR) repeat protein
MILLLPAYAPVLAVFLFTLIMIGAFCVATQFPRADALLVNGMELNQAGRPAKAERCFRKALARGSRVPIPTQVRLLVNLGDSLMDQGRYKESQECLDRALELGDPTGGCNSSIAALLLLQGAQPQKALDMADKALELLSLDLDDKLQSWWLQSWRGEWLLNLSRATLSAQRAWALALLGRQPDARQAIEAAANSLRAALAEVDPCKWIPPSNNAGQLVVQRIVLMGVSETQWTLGMALLAMNDTQEAGVCFKTAYDEYRRSKYGKLALQQCKQLGLPID